MAGQAITEREAIGPLPMAIRVPRFVGRERELAGLAQVLAASPAVVLVEGEAGIGKSRLVAEFLASSPARGRHSLVAACPPVRQPFTLGPVVDALRLATRDVGGLALSALAGALRSLFPEWADGLPPALEPLEDASATRHRLFGAMGELLDGLGVTVLVVEDVHWADEATLEFLLFLAARRPQRVSLLVTCRPEDVPDGSLLPRLARLAAGNGGLRLALPLLDVSQTACLVSSMLAGEAVSAEFAAFLHERTDGLPLAVEESVRLMGERADLTGCDGEWARRRLDEIDVPPTIRDAVLERTGRLGGDARQVLRAAAVLADPVGEQVVTAVSGLAAGRARAGLAGALDCSLLAEDGRGLMSFRHALASRAVYEAIPVLQRRQLHQRAGRVLERLSPPPVAQLARHFREAGAAGKWCQYAEQAADLALASGDGATAAALLHDLLVGAASRLPADAVARLTRKISLAALDGYTCLCDLARSLRTVLEGDALTPAQRAEVGGRLGRILISIGEYQSGVAELEWAVPGLAHRPVEAARAMIMLGWPCWTLWPSRVHRRWLDRAAATTASAAIPASDRLAITAERATVLLRLGEREGWAVAAQLPEDPMISPGSCHIAGGYLNIGDAATRWGRYGEARRRLAAVLQLADRYNYPRVQDATLVALAHLDWFTGSWTGLAGRVTALAGLDHVEPLFRLDVELVTGLLDAAAGAPRRAAGKLRLVHDEELRRGIVDLRLEAAAALARLCLQEGASHAGQAIALTDEPIQVITRKDVWLWATEIAPARVQALVAAGRLEEAGALVAAFGCGLGDLDAPAPQAALVLCRAILAEAGGQPGRAAALFARAAAAWQALPRPYDALLAGEAQARCLLAAGDRDAAVALLTQTLHGLSGLGATGDAERVVRTLRGHGVPVPRLWRHGRRGYGEQLSPRETEVVRLVVAGRTNREIAQALCRSPSTVAMQLSSAMRKLGVSSRTALAASVVAEQTPR